MDVRLSRAALRDLSEAVTFVAAENPDAAQRLRDRLIDAARQLGTFPEQGAASDGGWRVFSVPGTRYRLIYEVKPAHITLLRIYHGARQWPPARD